MSTLRFEGMVIRLAGLKEFIISLSGLEELRLVDVSLAMKKRMQNGQYQYDYSSENIKDVFDAVREHANRANLLVSFEKVVVAGVEWSLTIDLGQPHGVQKRLAEMARRDLYTKRPLKDLPNNGGRFPRTDLAFYLSGKSEWTPGLEARFQQQKGS
ncbi:hypothetical protein H2198_006800 [Neophaeococcomyces mojaviensis]|uniref:Uncharacterized protein n=1 Tax=Neophaeococcomyces mojaviensis TaxID=3383035 RepID=A0ACC3A206_9EURO|nr:hypothetical protein H2198_006800 [Knufia sp. JES_112]